MMTRSPQPSDAQGQVLLNMETLWQQAYPSECVIVRPTGIYGTSVARMIKLAEPQSLIQNCIGRTEFILMIWLLF
jgi:hypothetical protein